MLIRESKSGRGSHGESCTVHQFDLGRKDISFVVAEITGRYPEKGRILNRECSLVYYVLEGSAKVMIEGNPFDVSKGDVLLIPAGKRYFLEGDVKVAIPSSPAWHPEQYEEVE